MNRSIKAAFDLEMSQARQAYSNNDLCIAFAHLERAHILGQRYFYRHWLSHWWMLKVGVRRIDWREIIGQCMRLMAVIPGYVFGWVPKGNTGGADVSPIRPMPLPDDLEVLLKNHSVGRDVLVRFFVVLLALIIFVVVYFWR